MKTGIICFTQTGFMLAQRVEEILKKEPLCSDVEILNLTGRSENPEIPSLNQAAMLCMRKDACIFIGACGIAVRAIAPYVEDKTTDAAVLVLDEKGNYVIPLLSGHIGGANRIGKIIASALESELVLTTATDVNHKFAVDVYAAENGLILADMLQARKYAAAILEERDCLLRITNQVVQEETEEQVVAHLIPRNLYVGLGCKRGTPHDKIYTYVEETFQALGYDMRAIDAYATIDLKKDEEGITAFEDEGSRVFYYQASELMEVTGAFAASEFVEEVTGVDNVCERSAKAAAGEDAICRLPKQSKDGMTIAIYEKKCRYEKPQGVRFELGGIVECYES